MSLFKKKSDAAGQQKDPEKEVTDKRMLANGSYSVVITAVIIAAILVINFIIAAIPSKFTKFDVSSQKLYSIGDTTKKLLDGLKQDVTLYYYTDAKDEDTTITKLLDTYEGYSDKVTVKKIDAVSNPTALQKYTGSDTSVTLNSVVAVCQDKNKIADYNKFYISDSSGYSYSVTGFDAEGQITSAIASVTTDSSTKIYYTTGHNETALGTEMTDTLDKSGITTEELNLLNADIPDDCSTLLIYAPMKDFTADEAQKVISYLNGGGHALIISVSNVLSQSGDTPNFDSIMATYGVKRDGGIVLEGDQSKYAQVPYLILPTADSSSEITSGLSNENVVYALGEGLTVDSTKNTEYTVTPLLTTSDKAYEKKDLSSTLEKSDSDTEGSYTLAVSVQKASASTDTNGESVTSSSTAASSVTSASSASESVEASSVGSSSGSTASQDSGMKLAYYTTPCAFNSTVLTSILQSNVTLPSGNSTLFANTVKYLTNQEMSVSVASKDVSEAKATISAGVVSVLGNITMFVLPAIVLILGFTIWIRRKNR